MINQLALTNTTTRFGGFYVEGSSVHPNTGDHRKVSQSEAVASHVSE